VLTNHFSQANGRIATKLAHDGLQVSLRPACAQGQGQGQRSRDTGTFVLARKSLLEDYWDTWNYSLFTSSLQSTISCISIKFARWQHDCGRSLLSTIALFYFGDKNAFLTLIFQKLTEWCRLVAYLWDDPRKARIGADSMGAMGAIAKSHSCNKRL